MTTSTTIADIATKIAAVANKGAVSGSITTSGGSYTIPAGYHNGSGKVTGPTLATLVGTNVTLASAGNLLSGVTAYGKNGTKYTGSMTNRGAWTNTPTSSGKVTIPAGYHNGSGYVDTSKVYSAGGGGKIVIPTLTASNFNGSGEATAEATLYLGGLDNFKNLTIGKTTYPYSTLYIAGITSSGTATVLLNNTHGTSTGSVTSKTIDITNYSKVMINLTRYSSGGTTRAQIDDIVIS